MSVVGAFGTLYLRDQMRWMVVMMPLNAYAKKVWQKDIERFTSLRCITLDDLDSLDMVNDYDVILCKHTHLKSDKTELLHLLMSNDHTLLVIDEAHAFKNPRCQQTEILHEYIKDNKYRWFVTGTVLSKSLEDTYNILNLLQEGCLGNFWQFRSRWCLTETRYVKNTSKKKGEPKKVQVIVGIKNPNEFLTYIEPLIVTGESFVNVKFHYVDYELSDNEKALYRKVADGFELNPEYCDSDWIKQALSAPPSSTAKAMIKSVEKFSSRFIYLQSCADGTLTSDGAIENADSTKIRSFMNIIDNIVSKKQSVIVYFDYKATLEIIKDLLEDTYGKNIQVLCSTGDCVLQDGSVTEEKCKKKPHIILGTRASSESVSYYFINNVMFFHCPTVPHIATQLVGRITRKNTLYPDDLNCYFFRSQNIDLYKLKLVSFKCAQMELVQGHEGNIPDDYKVSALEDADFINKAKKDLLWRMIKK